MSRGLLGRYLKGLASRMRGEHSNGAARNPRSHVVSAAGQNDRDAGAEYEAGAVGIRQKTELLGQHVAGFEVRYEKDVGIAGDRRGDAFDACRVFTDCIVEGKRPVEESVCDLT